MKASTIFAITISALSSVEATKGPTHKQVGESWPGVRCSDTNNILSDHSEMHERWEMRGGVRKQ